MGAPALVEVIFGDELRAQGLGEEVLALTPESDSTFWVPARDGRQHLLGPAAASPSSGTLELYPVDRTRFGGSGSGLNSLEFSFREDGMADGFRATGGRFRNLRFYRVEEWNPVRSLSRRTGRTQSFLMLSTSWPI